MHKSFIAITVLLGGTLATVGCESDRTPPTTTPITLSGCLQRGDDGEFLLTRVNAPVQKNVGGTGTPAGVESEQLRQAWATYEIEPDSGLRLEGMLGKDIQVAGTVERNADFPKAEAQQDPKERANVDEHDVTKVKATTASIVAETCRGAESASAQRP